MMIQGLHRLVSPECVLLILSNLIHVEEEVGCPRIVVTAVPAIFCYSGIGGEIFSLQLFMIEFGIADE